MEVLKIVSREACDITLFYFSLYYALHIVLLNNSELALSRVGGKSILMNLSLDSRNGKLC